MKNSVLGRLLVAALVSMVVAAGLVPVADASAPVAERAAVRTVTYAGQGRTVHLGTVSRLTGTSRAFRSFVTARLNREWRLVGGRPSCKKAPYVTVKRWRSDGFAEISGVGTGDPCPTGGAAAIWLVRGGQWRAPALFLTQEARWCTDLKAYRVPVAFVGFAGYCYPDSGSVRKYSGFVQPAGIQTVLYAARLAARTVNRGESIGTARWASQGVANRLFELHDRGDVLTIVKCFTRADEAWAPYLGTAARGCLLDSAYYGNGGGLPTFRATYVLQMRPAALGRWRATGVVLESST